MSRDVNTSPVRGFPYAASSDAVRICIHDAYVRMCDERIFHPCVRGDCLDAACRDVSRVAVARRRQIGADRGARVHAAVAKRASCRYLGNRGQCTRGACNARSTPRSDGAEPARSASVCLSPSLSLFLSLRAKVIGGRESGRP